MTRKMLLLWAAVAALAAGQARAAGPGLTAADVLGPDGVVYPDWTYAGVPGGIPADVPVRAKVEDFGARADDDADDAPALERAARSVGEKGGGAVLLGQGTYHLDRPVLITFDNVVIRGQGPEKTRIINRYGPPKSGVAFFRPAPGTVVGPETWIEIHCRPDNLNAIRLFVDEDVKPAWSRERSEHWGGTFSGQVLGSTVVKGRPPGRHVLRAVAEFSKGKRLESALPVVFAERPGEGDATPASRFLGAITFAGRGSVGPRLLLAEDGRRGDLLVRLQSTGGLKPGDAIVIEAPATPRWKESVKCACLWGTYRQYQLRVEAVEGNAIRVNQPLRLPFPTVDGSYVQRVVPIRRCGVEGFYLEQTQKLWTSGVVFSNAWECWARNVHVRKAGQWAVYTTPAKWCEIRDCRLDDAWYQGGGGTAYVGFQAAWDCLMDNVRTTRMRHAPCYQWAASGNVIRNSTFDQSDGQWHAGWTNENLIELCTIDARTGTGSYGHGFWASPPEDKAHGPNGPRNVVYHCDVVCPKAGVWMGGMNEGWLILHNRIVCGTGPAVFMKTNSDGHLIADNVFVLKNAKSPGIVIQTNDCDGVRVERNRFYGGSGAMVVGTGRPASDRDNQALPLSESGLPPRPAPKVPSIFEWQRANVPRPPP